MWTQPLSRREMMTWSAAGLTASSLTGWLPVLAARAAEEKKSRPKACIVLWMDGGPPHTDTFDLKPNVPECGIFKPISTNVPGIQISELFPKFARRVSDAAIVRGMSTVENEHLRARVHLRTGYRDGQGGLSYPSLGSIMARERGNLESPLPNYVAIADRGDRSHGPGYSGTRFQPLFVLDPAKGVENLKMTVADSHLSRRLNLLGELEQGFTRTHQSQMSGDHRDVYGRAVQMMRTEQVSAFDLSQESQRLRDAYGNTPFGQGCLLARRLVETGVTFIEVGLGGWDTHFENNNAVRRLSSICDPGMSTLIEDLKDRGMLDSTLVIWMGEFGRTPQHKGLGRDHFARAWTTMMMGGGVKGGQVVGRTDARAATVEDRPIPVQDFFATICEIMGIDWKKQLDTAGGRPVHLVQNGAALVDALLP